MASRSEKRMSTYSGAPSLQPSLTPTLVGSPQHSDKGTIYGDEKPVPSSTSTLSSTDAQSPEIKTVARYLDKMNDARYDKQRYVMSGVKIEEVEQNALGAKLERALGRRMVGQDASFTSKKPVNEKRNLAVQAR